MEGHGKGGRLKLSLGHVKLRLLFVSMRLQKSNVSPVFPPCEVLPFLLVVCSPRTALLELVLRLLVLRCAGFAVVTFFLRLHSKILHKGWFCDVLCFCFGPGEVAFQRLLVINITYKKQIK